ncbi:hypothetical protein CEN39_09980, partial [Fischerella thermalis CCMEE 5201]
GGEIGRWGDGVMGTGRSGRSPIITPPTTTNKFFLASRQKKNTLHSKRGESTLIRLKTSWKISLSQEVGKHPLFLLELSHDSSFSPTNY